MKYAFIIIIINIYRGLHLVNSAYVGSSPLSLSRMSTIVNQNTNEKTLYICFNGRRDR
jgi:hypothetical protein